MIVIGKTVLSDDLAEKQFVCNLEKCKGACCVEGDLGAPLAEDELEVIDGLLEDVRPFMSDMGQKYLDTQGPYLKDRDGDFSTSTVDGRECVFAFYDKASILKCSFEAAFLAGNTSWPKPLSCHLYPIRITKYDHYEALNYHHWHICSPACKLGEELSVPVYRFLRNPLIRKYGEAWYKDLEEKVSAMDKKNG